MSEQRVGGEALHQDMPADVEVPGVVEGVVGGFTVEATNPPEPVLEKPFTLRHETGEKISAIFARMREEGDPEDELTDLEERFRAGLRAEEEASRAVVEGLQQEARDLAASNNNALEMLQAKRATLGRLEELKQKADAELEAKKAHLEKAHAALIKLGEKGGTAEEIEAVMAEIDPEAAEKLIAARHELREKPAEPVESAPEAPAPEFKPVEDPEAAASDAARAVLTTPMAKLVAPVEKPAEPTRIIVPVGGETGGPEEQTQPYDVQAEFTASGEAMAYGQQSGVDAAAPAQVSPSGQPKVPRYVARMQAMGVDPKQIARHWPTQQQ